MERDLTGSDQLEGQGDKNFNVDREKISVAYGRLQISYATAYN
jgi:hypothetical protein